MGQALIVPIDHLLESGQFVFDQEKLVDLLLSFNDGKPRFGMFGEGFDFVRGQIGIKAYRSTPVGLGRQFGGIPLRGIIPNNQHLVFRLHAEGA